MGIKGLFSFMQNCGEDALEWHKLQNCRIVIDGNNLACDLFNCCTTLNVAFGGDYDKYAATVVEFFRKLNSCNVESYVLMDGGYNIYRSKFDTLHMRASSQVQASVNFDPLRRNQARSFPLLLQPVFVNSVQKCGVHILQCDFEADDDIIVIARKLHAYILSNDSDFYATNIPFILLNTLNIKKIQKEVDELTGHVSRFIPAYLFKPEVFCKIAKIPIELLPLLAPLLGNDMVSPITTLHGKLEGLRPNTSSLTCQHKRIFSVIKWLRGQPRNPEIVLEKVLDSSQLDKRSRKAYQEVLLSYNPTESTLEPWFSAHEENCPLNVSKNLPSRDYYACGSKRPYLSDRGLNSNIELLMKCTCKKKLISELMFGMELPRWFLAIYRSCLLPRFVANIWNKNFLFTGLQIEYIEYNTSFVVLQSLIKNIRALLWATVYRSEEIKKFQLQTPVFFRNLLDGISMDAAVEHKDDMLSLSSDDTNSECNDDDPPICNVDDKTVEENQEKEALSKVADEIVNANESNRANFKEDNPVFGNNGENFIKKQENKIGLEVTNVDSDAFERTKSKYVIQADDAKTDSNRTKPECDNPVSGTNEKDFKEDQEDDDSSESEIEAKFDNRAFTVDSWDFIENEENDVQFKVSEVDDDRTKLIDKDLVFSPNDENVEKNQDKELSSNVPVGDNEKLELDNGKSDNLKAIADNKESEEDQDKKKQSCESKIRLPVFSETQNYKKFLRTKNVPPIQWYTRNFDQLVVRKLKPFHVNAWLKFYPTLFEMESLSFENKRKIFHILTARELTFSEELPGELEFILYITCFWYLAFRKRLHYRTLLSNLVCFIMFYVVKGCGDNKKKPKFKGIYNDCINLEKRLDNNTLSETKNMPIKKLIASLTKEEINCARFSLHKYHTANNVTRDTYDRIRVHNFSDFISSFQLLTCLNTLLNFPYPFVSIESFWSGTFCYNVHNRFTSKTNDLKPSDVIALFGFNKRIAYLYIKLYSLISEHLPIEKLDEDQVDQLMKKSVNVNWFVKMNQRILKLSDRDIGITKNSQNETKNKETRKSRKKSKGQCITATDEFAEPEPEFDMIADPTEEDLEILASNRFSQLILTAS